MQKKIQGEKLIQTLILPKLSSAREFLAEKEWYEVHIKTLFTQKEAEIDR